MKELNFKYNKHEFFALRDLYERTVLQDDSKDINDRLLIALLMNVYKRIYSKSFELKEKYGLTYKPEEAIAFMLYFKDTQTLDIYEQRLINMTLATTDKHLL